MNNHIILTKPPKKSFRVGRTRKQWRETKTSQITRRVICLYLFLVIYMPVDTNAQNTNANELNKRDKNGLVAAGTIKRDSLLSQKKK